MKIFFLPAGYPCDAAPRLMPFHQVQARALAGLGNEVVILNPRANPTRKLFSPVSGEVRRSVDGEMPVFYAGYQHLKFPQSYGCRAFVKAAERLFNAAVGEFGLPDVILANFTLYAGYAGALLSEKYGVPLVVVEHQGRIAAGKVTEYERSLLEAAVGHSAGFYCNSFHLAEAVAGLTGADREKIGVMRNIMSLKYTYKPPKDDGRFVFFSAGNLFRDKCFDLLIESFAEAFENSADVELRIAGGGPEKSNLVRLVKKLHMTNVTFLGSLDESGMAAEYESCGCFVLPSRKESFGLVYREAMAVGRPIITTAHGGIAGTFDPRDGYIVPIDDKAALTRALVKMRREYSSFDGEEISARCLVENDPKKAAAELNLILENAIKSKGENK